jgi:hypothetical protein
VNAIRDREYGASACVGIEGSQHAIDSIDKLDEDSAGVTTEDKWSAFLKGIADLLDRGRLGGGVRTEQHKQGGGTRQHGGVA